jgi:uncharacterized damage-inducible protein DinB
MSEIARILDQFDRAYRGEAWHGPSLRALLDGVTAQDAAKHPVQGAHSIWELVNHLAAWHQIVRRELAGEAVEVTPEMDWPPVWEVSEVAWRRALDVLDESRKRLRTDAEKLKEAQLNETPASQKYSRYVMLHGLVQHDLYHAGQIAILEKALR